MPDITEKITSLSRSLDTAHAGVKGKLERISAELSFAWRLRELHPDNATEWEQLIGQALDQVNEALSNNACANLPAAIAKAEATLQPIGAVAKQYTIWNVGHGHIDMNWMWSWPETVSVTIDTFRTVLALMDAYNDFHYSQSQTSVYDLLRIHDPELLDRIAEKVKEGRWEITASHWVEADKNLTGGESFCRHLLYTRAFMHEHFGLEPADVPIDWEPDTFGHAHTIPSFLARGGVKRYYHCRSGIGEKRPAVFWWQAPDKSRVLVYHEISGSWYNGRVETGTTNSMIDFCKETGLKAWMNVYGVGDHGGGPTREDIERCHAMNEWPIYPTFVLSSTKPFYELLEQNGDQWPVLDKELNFEFQGCYTTQTSIKKANRFGENQLYEAEAAATVASAQTGMTYPADRFREGWINTLFSQFHDILPGSGVRDTRDYCMGQFQETMARTGSIVTRSLRALAGDVNTAAIAGEATAVPGPASGAGAGFQSALGGVSHLDGQAESVRPFVVFNLNGWSRSEVVEATVWDTAWDKHRICVEDDTGAVYAAQPIGEGHYWGHNWRTVVFPAKNIPAMGYRTFVLREGKADVVGALSHPARGVVENEFIRMEVDWTTGGIKSLIDKKTGIDFADPTDPMGLFEFAIERHHGMSAWVIGDIKSSRMLIDVESVEQHAGPYRTAFKSTIKVAESRIVMETIVRAGDPTVELNINVNWFERGTPERGVPMLRLHIPTSIETVTPRYEIPCGTITRTLTDGEEVPSQRFCDLNARDGSGVCVVNDSKYGFAVEGSSLRATLIRSSYDPDPLPEIGEHTMRFGIRPHGAAWTPTDDVKAGAAFNQPLRVVGTNVHAGSLPPVSSWLGVEQPNVVLAAVKRAEDGQGMILRVYETDGRDTECTIAVDKAFGVSSAVEVDLLEQPLARNTAQVAEGRLAVKISAHGITSVRLA